MIAGDLKEQQGGFLTVPEMTNIQDTGEPNVKEGLEGDLLHEKTEMQKKEIDARLLSVPKQEGLGHSVKHFPFKDQQINLFTHSCCNYLLIA